MWKHLSLFDLAVTQNTTHPLHIYIYIYRYKTRCVIKCERSKMDGKIHHIRGFFYYRIHALRRVGAWVFISNWNYSYFKLAHIYIYIKLVSEVKIGSFWVECCRIYDRFSDFFPPSLEFLFSDDDGKRSTRKLYLACISRSRSHCWEFERKQFQMLKLTIDRHNCYLICNI